MDGEPVELPEGIERVEAGPGESVKYDAEVVVVGLGAGGGMVLHQLADRGVDVLGVEMGGYFPPEKMELAEEKMMPRLFAEGGARATADMAINVMQGNGVGGSTVHNTNLCKRLPRPVLERWERDWGVEGLDGRLDSDFEAVEKMLNVHPIPEDRVNANNQVLLRGVEQLGYEGGGLSYNRKLCRASGFCELGCPNDGKENAARALVLPALEEGARVLSRVRIDEITRENGGATGVVGRAVDPGGEPGAEVVIRANRVVLAASATGSAALALQSGIPDPHGLVGRRLHLHPGAFVMGIFDDDIEGWLGVPQSAECTEFLQFGEGADHRVWLVTGFAHPGTAAGLMPGFGARHGSLMKRYPNVAAIITMLHDEYSGAVRPGNGERVHIHYSLDADEYAQMALGMREAARILFAAGAREVLLPLSPPILASSMTEAAQLSAADLGPLNPPMVAVHPMSTMWMGENPRNSVVDSYGKHHHLDGLFVADGSLFPASIGGPPQIPIYTMGRRVARRVADSLQ